MRAFPRSFFQFTIAVVQSQFGMARYIINEAYRTFFLHVSNNLCVCVSRNEDFFSLRSNFLRCCSSRWQNIHTFYTCVVTYVHKYVRALVCKFVVLSFVQCTLVLNFLNSFHVGFVERKIFSCRTLLHLLIFVVLLPDFPRCMSHHHSSVVLSTAMSLQMW